MSRPVIGLRTAWNALAREPGRDYAVVMAPQRLGIFLLCVGALNVLVGTMLAIQVPPERIGWSPYIIIFCGLILMFGGYYTGKRKA